MAAGDEMKNLYRDIQKDVCSYFDHERISWWGGDRVTGHILSSQVACMNHLFAVRNERKTVLEILNRLTGNLFEDVLPVECDRKPAYISFETVSSTDYLNECKAEKRPTRGTQCTSVDALMIGKGGDGAIRLIPIEWKYTEFYPNTDKSTEDRPGETKGTEGKGRERLSRYSVLIDGSKQLNSLPSYRASIYFIEPFYQLMRQTLWAEQMIAHKIDEKMQAEDFLHIHVVPGGNADLLEKQYRYAEVQGMEAAWKSCLNDPAKYIRVDPVEIVRTIEETCRYNELAAYLKTRYYK